MEALPGLWSLSPLGAMIGVLVLQFYWLSTSRLYTRKQHDEIMALQQVRGDEWKETSGKWEAVATEAMTQLAQIAPELKIVGDFFSKVPTNPSSGDNGTEEG